LDKSTLHATVWDHQYQLWRWDAPHTLPPFYPLRTVSSALPLYMHLDTPEIAAYRARLRFDRARLRYSQHRLKFPDVTDVKCNRCNYDEEESVEHVLAYCPAYVEPRAKCFRALRLLRLPRVFFIPPLDATIIAPDSDIKSHRLLSLVLAITGKYIKKVQAARNF
jgi:hypothetical protein